MFIQKIQTDDVLIQHFTYAHRLQSPLMVAQITADFSQSAVKSVTLNLVDNPGADSSDITFTAPRDFTQRQGKEQNGTTKIVEDPRYQTSLSPVYVIYTDVSISFVVFNWTA